MNFVAKIWGGSFCPSLISVFFQIRAKRRQPICSSSSVRSTRRIRQEGYSSYHPWFCYSIESNGGIAWSIRINSLFLNLESNNLSSHLLVLLRQLESWEKLWARVKHASSEGLTLSYIPQSPIHEAWSHFTKHLCAMDRIVRTKSEIAPEFEGFKLSSVKSVCDGLRTMDTVSPVSVCESLRIHRTSYVRGC